MTRKDPAGVLANLLEGHGGQQADNINVAFPCKVISFDADTLTASVQPLLKLTAAQPAMIQAVPVTGQKISFQLDVGNGLQVFETTLRPILKRDDVVFVVCADAEIRNTLSGRIAAPNTGRRHSRNDAVIVGVMPCSL